MKDIFFKLLELCGDLPFLPERMKIEKVEQFVANLHDKTQYIIHIRNLKQALNHGLVLKKVHKMIKVNENVWLELYIDMNTDQEKKAKNDFEKDLFKLMNNSGFGKIMENMREDRHYLVSETNYHTIKFFTENLLAIEMKKTEILIRGHSKMTSL